MNRYEGCECPVCRVKLFDEDDIVVCPDCGAPYHRACWNEANGCVFASAHGTDMQYQPPKLNMDEPSSDDGGDPDSPENEERMTDRADDFSDEEDSREQAIERMLASEGVADGDTVGKVSARQIALCVGFNAKRYIRVFKGMFFSGSKTGWNWLAFLFPQYWLLGRKCYKAGSLMTIFSLFCSLMMRIMNGTTYSLYNHMTAAYQNPALLFTSPDLLTLLILALLSLAVRVLLGLFGDNLYKRHVFSAIDEWKNSDESDDEFALVKKGGVNLFIPLVVYMFADVAVYAIAAFIL